MMMVIISLVIICCIPVIKFYSGIVLIRNPFFVPLFSFTYFTLHAVSYFKLLHFYEQNVLSS